MWKVICHQINKKYYQKTKLGHRRKLMKGREFESRDLSWDTITVLAQSLFPANVWKFSSCRYIVDNCVPIMKDFFMNFTSWTNSSSLYCFKLFRTYNGPCWWSNGQRACLQFWKFKFESLSKNTIISVKFILKKTKGSKKRPGCSVCSSSPFMVRPRVRVPCTPSTLSH